MSSYFHEWCLMIISEFTYLVGKLAIRWQALKQLDAMLEQELAIVKRLSLGHECLEDDLSSINDVA